MPCQVVQGNGFAVCEGTSESDQKASVRRGPGRTSRAVENEVVLDLSAKLTIRASDL
jgi:hypothetical protein